MYKIETFPAVSGPKNFFGNKIMVTQDLLILILQS